MVPPPGTTLRYTVPPKATRSDKWTRKSLPDGVSALSPGGTSNESDSETAPSTPGLYWIGACVDSVNGEQHRQ